MGKLPRFMVRSWSESLAISCLGEKHLIFEQLSGMISNARAQ